MIDSFFGVVKSPDTTDGIAQIVIKPTLVMNPDSNNIAFKLCLLIIHSFWRFVWKLNYHGRHGDNLDCILFQDNLEVVDRIDLLLVWMLIHQSVPIHW